MIPLKKIPQCSGKTRQWWESGIGLLKFTLKKQMGVVAFAGGEFFTVQ